MSYQEIGEHKVLIGSSYSPRVKETTKQVVNVLGLSDDISEVDSLAYKNKEGKRTKLAIDYENFLKHHNGEENLNDRFIQSFLIGNENIVSSAEAFAKPYLHMIKSFFNKVEKSGISHKILAFRHGQLDSSKKIDNDILYPLTNKGKEQGKILGQRIKEKISQDNNNSIIRILGTHALVNECLCGYLLGYKNLPDSWKKGLNYTEEIEYLFEKELDDVVLKITRAGETRSITKKEFEEKFGKNIMTLS